MPIENELRSAWEREGHHRAPELDLRALYGRARKRSRQRVAVIGTAVAASIAGVVVGVQLVSLPPDGVGPAETGTDDTVTTAPSQDATTGPDDPTSDPDDPPTEPDGPTGPADVEQLVADVADSVGMEARRVEPYEGDGVDVSMSDGDLAVLYTLALDQDEIPASAKGDGEWVRTEGDGATVYQQTTDRSVKTVALSEAGTLVTLTVVPHDGETGLDQARADHVVSIVLPQLLDVEAP